MVSIADRNKLRRALARKRLVVGLAVLATAVVSLVVAGPWVAGGSGGSELDLSPGGEVKRLSGDHLKLEDGRSIEFAGIRLPYGHEPYAQQARKTLRKWIADEGVRLRFDEDKEHHREGRLLAYVYANDTFINERLVRAGLAFVRLQEGNRKHAELFLAAQREARTGAEGVWRFIDPDTESRLLGNAENATFHRLDCESIRKRDDWVELSGLDDGWDRGWAPCGKCRPLGTSEDATGNG